MLDKGRATIAGHPGEYHYNCPLDQQLLEFVGIDAEQLKEELAKDKSDGEILHWIHAHARNKRSAFEIAAWSKMQVHRVPPDLDSRKFFNELHTALAPNRKDVATWFDLLDIDDYATFGGKP